MAQRPPNPRLRARIEFGIRVLAPFLDMLLFAAERVSRLLEGEDPTYAVGPVPAPGEPGERAARGAPERRATMSRG